MASARGSSGPAQTNCVGCDGAPLQPEPEAGESPTALENLLCCTSAKDFTPQGPQQLQAGGSDIPPDEDPGAVGPGSASAPCVV